MDQDKLRRTIAPSLTRLELSPSPRPPDIDKVVEAVTVAILEGIKASTPWSRPTSLSKPGFTSECRDLQKEARHAKREVVQYQAQHQETCPDSMWSRFNKLKRAARRRIPRYRNACHHRKFTEASESGEIRQVWNLSRWARDRTPYQS